MVKTSERLFSCRLPKVACQRNECHIKLQCYDVICVSGSFCVIGGASYKGCIIAVLPVYNYYIDVFHWLK